MGTDANGQFISKCFHVMTTFLSLGNHKTLELLGLR